MECCGPHRSNLRDVLPSGFLPAPVKFKRSGDGKIIAANVSDKNGKFFPLFQQLACNMKPSFSGYLKEPYDYNCSSVHSNLFDRTCSVCGLYFCSQKYLKAHMTALHSKNENSMMCRRIRPHVLYRCQDGEASCLNNREDIELEWVDIETIEDNCLEELLGSDDEEDFRGFPPMNDISEWVASPWQEDKSQV